MNPLRWWSTQSALWKRLERAGGMLARVRRTLFSRYLDNCPEMLLASALADAEARELDSVCVFFSHVAEPELLRSTLNHPRVSGTGTKVRLAEGVLPDELRGDLRVGRYWEPGEWCIPARPAHVYFVGPWRLLTWSMLLQATRSGTRSLHCRVATSWIAVPLTLVRVARGFVRASGLPALLGGARAAAQLGASFWRFTTDVRTTLFILHLDNLPEVLVASALEHAKGRSLDKITIFFSHSAHPAILREVLQKEGVVSTGVKDSAVDSLLPADLAADRRVGRYWEPGSWILPEAVQHVYFVGPWRLITLGMLREALRRDVSTLRVRVATSWATVPLPQIRSCLPVLRATARAATSAHQTTRRAFRAACRKLAAVTLAIRPSWTDFVTRIAGESGVKATSLDRIFRHMLGNGPPSVEAIPGRVVLVCGSLAPGGAERQVVYTLSGLAAQRFESVRLLCHYLTPGSRHRYDFYLPAVQAAGIRAHEIRRRTEPSDPASMPDGLKEIATLLPAGLAVDIAHLYSEFSELRPEVVHTWLDWDNVRGGLAAALAGVPRVVISGRNINPSHFALYQPYMDPAYRVLAELPNVTIINNSRAGADDYADWIGIPRDRIKVVHNAVDFGDRKRLSVSECAHLRALLEIPEGSFVIGGVFRLEEEKRPILWVQAAALLARQVSNMHFVIFGQGTKHAAVLEAAEREGISHRLTLAGVTNDVLSAMSIMDLFLLTSFGEGLPNVVLEAQWAGTPVVVTDVGGAREALEPGRTGWAIDTDAPQDLAAHIKWLHDNPAQLQAARIRGPQWVRQQFGITRMIEETVRVYGLPPLTLAGDMSCALSELALAPRAR